MPNFICANSVCSKHFYNKKSKSKYCSRCCAGKVNSAANIAHALRQRRKFSDQEMVQMLTDLGERLGKTPSQRDVNKHLPIHSRTYSARFESYRNATVLAGFEPNLSFPPAFEEGDRNVVPLSLRFVVLQRDQFRCQYCGGTPQDGYVLHVDHKIPRSRGGLAEEDNLITSCAFCNLGKSNLVVVT